MIKIGVTLFEVIPIDLDVTLSWSAMMFQIKIMLWWKLTYINPPFFCLILTNNNIVTVFFQKYSQAALTPEIEIHRMVPFFSKRREEESGFILGQSFLKIQQYSKQYKMSQKQNNKFVLGRLYPQYFKSQKAPKQESAQRQPPKITKSIQEKKLQSKLKMIIYNLEKQLQQQPLINKSKLYGHDNTKNSVHSKASVRSYSQKSLGSQANSHRYHTELETEESQNTERALIGSRLKKRSQKNRQSENLILPKLKLNHNIYDHEHRKELLSKKKKKKLEKLEEEEHELGKIVLEKVEEHFQKEKAGRKHYYERVKSEEGIDQSFVTYLKNKVKKANIALEN